MKEDTSLVCEEVGAVGAYEEVVENGIEDEMSEEKESIEVILNIERDEIEKKIDAGEEERGENKSSLSEAMFIFFPVKKKCLP